MSLDNVPKAPGVARPKAPAEYPKYFWSPSGEQMVANSIGDVPAGYTPYSPLDTERAAAATGVKSAAEPMTKKEVVNALKEGGIAHDAAASHSSLYALLLSGVKTALTEANIAFNSDETDVKKLLGLFPAS